MESGESSIVFYRTNNVCNGDAVVIKKGEYNFDDSMWQPILAKVGPLTTLVIYFSDDKKKLEVYNNPYSDRYVVIRLQTANIKSVKIEAYSKCLEHMHVDCEKSTIMSSMDIVILIIIISLFILFRLR
jgi:hypothetical protein